MTSAEVEQRREARRLAHETARAEQEAIDLVELDKLEEAHGWDGVEPIRLSRWEPGAATMLVIRIPRASEHVYRRFQQQANADKAKGAQKVEASETLGRSCVVYPDPKSDLYEKTVDIAPGILGHAAHRVVMAVQGKEEEEGK